MQLNVMKKLILVIVVIYLNCLNIKAKDYVIESQGKRVFVKEHIYSKKDSLKIFKLDGTFKDNAGNFGEFNSIVNVKIINNFIESLDASNEFSYNKNIKAYNIAIRENSELEQGVGRWYFNYASKDIDAIINENPWLYLNQFNGDLACFVNENGKVITGAILIHDTAGNRSRCTFGTQRVS